jgi:histidinol-phosphate phosphatase family protein
VLFDRDGTLVHDVAYNGDPAAVAPVAGAVDAVARARAAGLGVAVVTNQSGIAQGILTAQQVDAVNRRVDQVVGPVDHWFLCPHGPQDGCACRKPAPGMVRRAAARFRVSPLQCAMIGDTEADVAAGRSGGARSILVPNPATRADEVAWAPETAPTVGAAVDRLLGAGT